MTLFQRFLPHKTIAIGPKLTALCQHFVHIPPYQQPDQHHLPQPDLNAIIAKSRFISFYDDIEHAKDMSNGSFILQLSTSLPHATYLVEPIWKNYYKKFAPTKYDIECMLNYYNTNESWTKGSYFIKRYILNHGTYHGHTVSLSSKSWKYICEISLKATNHNECISLLEEVINYYNPNVIGWKEMVKIFLIKRALHKIVHYSAFIIEYIIQHKDSGLLDIIIHSFKILLNKNNNYITQHQLKHIKHCIDILYPNDNQKRTYLYSSITQPMPHKLKQQHTYKHSNNSNDNEMNDMNAISLDIIDDKEEKECAVIALKLNCLQFESKLTAAQYAYGWSATYEWIFNACLPHHFLYLFCKQYVDSNSVWQFCLLALLKCQFKFNENIVEFFKVITGMKCMNSGYGKFVMSLAHKYVAMDEFDEATHQQLQYEIVQFIKFQDIMFWSFEHLQKWLYELLMIDCKDNKRFVEYLFNLMVMGMLYNDSFENNCFRIRPQLRGLLRFGSYFKLRFIPSVLFVDDIIYQYLNGALFDLHHPLNPFKFYTKQICEYNKSLNDIAIEIENNTTAELELQPNEEVIGNVYDIDDDYNRQYQFMNIINKNITQHKNILNPFANTN